MIKDQIGKGRALAMAIGERKQTYLGDGAYIEWTGYSFVVYASNGIERTHEVYLEPEHIAALIEFAQSVVSIPHRTITTS